MLYLDPESGIHIQVHIHTQETLTFKIFTFVLWRYVLQIHGFLKTPTNSGQHLWG